MRDTPHNFISSKALTEEVNVYTPIIILTIFWGIWLRITNIGTPSFWLDEAFSVEAAQQLITSEIPSLSLLASDFSLSNGFLYQYLLSQTLYFLGESEANVRYISVISGVLLIIVILIFCLKNFGIRAAASSTVLMSMSYWQIAWSRQAREYILLSLIFWLALVAIYKISSSNKIRGYEVSITALLILFGICIHWFALTLIVSILFMFIIKKIYTISSYPKLHAVILLSIITIISIFSLRFYFDMKAWWIDTYSAFVLKSYWPLLLLSLMAPLTVKEQKHKILFLWLGATTLFAFMIIATAIPMVNMRYIFFLTPVLIIYVSASFHLIPVHSKKLHAVIVIVSISLLTLTKVITWKPASIYILENQNSHDGLEFFTPQPDFISAYTYINTNLNEVNLITPYPAVSRRYRDTDDILAFNIGTDFLPQHTKQTEREKYTNVQFATFPKLKKALMEKENLYFLVDDMYLQRISYEAQKTIYTPDKIVKSWRNPPYSSLYLFRIK